MTSASPTTMTPVRLPVLASSINDHLVAAEQATERGLEHVVAAGLLLLEARGLAAPGEWLGWLQANCPALGQRQSQTYMRLARNRHNTEMMQTAAVFLPWARLDAEDAP